MKKRSCLLALALLICLAGCGKKPQETPPLPEPPAEMPQQTLLEVDVLRVEFPREGLGVERLSAAVKELPVLLETYFAAEEFVQIKDVQVTVGSSAAATALALAQGTIDLAFLPAESFVEFGDHAAVLFGDAQGTDALATKRGTRSFICAAPTKYGDRLAKRVNGKKLPTWQELDRARWGVLEPSSLGGYRGFDLWLADHYEGNCIGDLSSVTVYEGYEDLFRAVAAGDVDAFAIRDDARELVADAWGLSGDRTVESGMRGFDRSEPIWEETKVLAETEYVFTTVAAVSDTTILTDGRFVTALDHILRQLSEEHPNQMEVLGTSQFVAVSDAELDATRRLTTISG